MIDDINFDDTEDGKQAKIVVKEAIRRAQKLTEDLHLEFEKLNEKYCEGTFKGFATPIDEIDSNFKDLKSQFDSVKQHAIEYDLSLIITEWIGFIEDCIIKADENKSKWEFSEAYRNIIFGLASCKNYELLLQVLNSWGGDSETSQNAEDEDFIDFYEILNVNENATDDQIRKAYKELAKKWHPDKHHHKTNEEKEEADRNMKILNDAKDTLLDKEKRKIFDEKRNSRKEKNNV